MNKMQTQKFEKLDGGLCNIYLSGNQNVNWSPRSRGPVQENE